MDRVNNQRIELGQRNDTADAAGTPDTTQASLEPRSTESRWRLSVVDSDSTFVVEGSACLRPETEADLT